MADNDGLIQKETEHLAYTYPYPNTMLELEFDLVEEIYATHQSTILQLSFKHVKGHQDWSKALRSSPFTACTTQCWSQFSCFIILLGGSSFHNEHHLMTPSHRAKLSIQGVSITNDDTRQLLRAYTEAPYIKYLQESFHWSKHVVALQVSWTGLQWRLQRIQRHCLTTKICNDILPTATTLKQCWWHQTNDLCVLCGAPEISTHSICCQHPSRKK